jgi:hypothetical protein
MIIDKLKLSRFFYTTLDFNYLKDRLKRKIGVSYKLGIIDNEEITIYYYKDIYSGEGLDVIPTCKIEIKNKTQEDGRVQIRFTIAEFYLVAIGLIPLIFAMIFYFTKAPIPIYFPLGLYPILYFILVYILSNQSDKFYTDLKELETKAK